MRRGKTATNSFTLTLRCDSAIMLGGAKSMDLDPARWLRGTSVRGLLHAYTRALFAPYLDGNFIELYKREHELLGDSAGDNGAPPTFRVDDVSGTSTAPSICHLLPHKGLGSRQAYPRNTQFTLRFTPRLYAVKNFPRFFEVLLATAWTAFTFGALGKRSTRGYGGLTIAEIAHTRDNTINLPAFAEPPDSDHDLGVRLREGLEVVQSVIKGWLEASDLPEDFEARAHSTFCLGTLAQVSVGKKFEVLADTNDPPRGSALLCTLMRACSRGWSNSPNKEFELALGHAGKDRQKGQIVGRLKSPLRVRVFQVKGGFIPVLTYSKRTDSKYAAGVYQDILSAMGATNRTLDTFR